MALDARVNCTSSPLLLPNGDVHEASYRHGMTVAARLAPMLPRIRAFRWWVVFALGSACEPEVARGAEPTQVSPPDTELVPSGCRSPRDDLLASSAATGHVIDAARHVIEHTAASACLRRGMPSGPSPR
jgi:hypothetical protein